MEPTTPIETTPNIACSSYTPQTTVPSQDQRDNYPKANIVRERPRPMQKTSTATTSDIEVGISWKATAEQSPESATGESVPFRTRKGSLVWHKTVKPYHYCMSLLYVCNHFQNDSRQVNLNIAASLHVQCMYTVYILLVVQLFLDPVHHDSNHVIDELLLNHLWTLPPLVCVYQLTTQNQNLFCVCTPHLLILCVHVCVCVILCMHSWWLCTSAKHNYHLAYN